jgi:hypothetical protein
VKQDVGDSVIAMRISKGPIKGEEYPQRKLTPRRKNARVEAEVARVRKGAFFP